MKKLLALLLVLAMATSFVACGKTENVEEDVPAVNEESQLNEEVVPEEEQQEEPEAETPAETEKEEKEETKKPSEDKKPSEKPAEDKEPASTPADKPAQTPANKPASTPADKPAQAPVNKPAQTPAEKPVTKPAETPSETPAEKPAENKTVGSKLASEFNAKAKSGAPLAIAEAMVNGGSLPFMAGAMEVEPGLLAGFDNYEVTGFKSGAVFQPMIGSIAFIGYVFEVEDGVSASDFAQNLKKNANLRWNICVEAEEMVTSVVGNKVFFVMCPKSFEE